ncbi:MAG: glycosyltransferase family 2 protein [Pyrinomonadaceae bacterium]
MSSTKTTSSTTQPLVSVVTPAYNQAAFLRDTIESVLSQDYPAIEHQIIDDGSTDETPQILAEYEGRAWIERHENRGQTPTINKGWERAKGDILTWLNSDDTFLPGAVTAAVEYFEKNPDVGIVFGDTLFTDEHGSPLDRSPDRSTFSYESFVRDCENPIPQPSAFIRRSVIEDVGMLDPEFYYFMDWDFWLRAGVNHRIEYVPELWSTYRLHSESKTVAQANKAAPELEYMYKKFFADPDLPPRIRALERQAMVNMLFTTAGYYLTAENRKAAAQTGWRALRQAPSMFFRPSLMHKLIYSLYGGSSLYEKSRNTYHRARAGVAG